MAPIVPARLDHPAVEAPERGIVADDRALRRLGRIVGGRKAAGIGRDKSGEMLRKIADRWQTLGAARLEMRPERQDRRVGLHRDQRASRIRKGEMGCDDRGSEDAQRRLPPKDHRDRQQFRRGVGQTNRSLCPSV